MLEAMPGILPGVDPQAADVVGHTFRRRKIKVLTGVSVTGSIGAPTLMPRRRCATRPMARRRRSKSMSSS